MKIAAVRALARVFGEHADDDFDVEPNERRISLQSEILEAIGNHYLAQMDAAFKEGFAEGQKAKSKRKRSV